MALGCGTRASPAKARRQVGERVVAAARVGRRLGDRAQAVGRQPPAKGDRQQRRRARVGRRRVGRRTGMCGEHLSPQN